MKLTSALVFLSLFFLMSCSTSINRNQDTGAMDVKVRGNLVADIDVDMTRKIQGSAHQSKLFGLIWLKHANHYADGVAYSASGHAGFFGPGMTEETKSAAAYKAVTPVKADLLVAPQYIIKEKSYFFGAYKEVTATVSGYAGKVRNISGRQTNSIQHH